MKPKNNRHSIRLQGYDYSQDGWYFITICVSEFREVFGEINDGIFSPNEWGKIVEDNLRKTAKIRQDKMGIDIFQVMPNHLHFIVTIGDNDNLPNISGFPDTNAELTQFSSPVNNLGSAIRGLKGKITSQIQIKEGITDLKLWQRNYYEHIIRDTNELDRIKKYIYQNPLKWQQDRIFFKKLLSKMTKK